VQKASVKSVLVIALFNINPKTSFCFCKTQVEQNASSLEHPSNYADNVVQLRDARVCCV